MVIGSYNKAIHEWLETDSGGTLTAKVKLEWLINPSKFNDKRVCLFTEFFYLKMLDRCLTRSMRNTC